MQVSVVALFCEDIREEKSGQDTLIGILSDNLSLPGATTPLLLPKLAVYIRVHISPTDIYQKIEPRLKIPGVQDMLLPSMSNLIAQVQKDARANGAPLTGLIGRAAMSPFVVNAWGRIEAIVNIDGTDHIAGTLNLSSVSS